MQNGNEQPPHVLALQAMFCITPPLATVWVHTLISLPFYLENNKAKDIWGTQ